MSVTHVGLQFPISCAERWWDYHRTKRPKDFQDIESAIEFVSQTLLPGTMHTPKGGPQLHVIGEYTDAQDHILPLYLIQANRGCKFLLAGLHRWNVVMKTTEQEPIKAQVFHAIPAQLPDCLPEDWQGSSVCSHAMRGYNLYLSAAIPEGLNIGFRSRYDLYAFFLGLRLNE